MYFVVLETSTQHFPENPKDQTKIKEFFYQIIDAKTFECTFEREQSLKVDPNGLNSTVTQLDKIIKDFTKDSDFIVCSLFSTWVLRVVLKRQAYDESITLPNSLQHLKIFNLWKEYAKFYENRRNEFVSEKLANHNVSTATVSTLDGTDDPDSTRFINMLKILSLSPQALCKQSDDEDSSVAENIGSSISEESNNALLELDNITKIKLDSLKNIKTTVLIILKLFELVKNDENDLKNVFALPDNLELDFRTFQNEKSTILYMSNLPIDTTQNELESWFTQYGTRPIGFWTFRNILDDVANNPNMWELNQYSYVEELNSISGFVVFQNHEDAMQALFLLNGRSMLSNVANTKQPRVVEHIIELQPSSNSVIDSAFEILVPFQQSKNKPRPGDWHCPSCGFLNFQRRTACFRCSFPIPSSFQKGKSDFNGNSEDFNSNQSTNSNTKITTNCGNLKMDQRHHTISFNSIENNNNGLFDINQRMKHTNSSSRPNSNHNTNGYSSIPFRAGDWKCAVCDYHNFAKNIICLRCGGPKMSNTHTRDSLNKITKHINSRTNYNDINNDRDSDKVSK